MTKKFLLTAAAVFATIASVHGGEISDLRKADEEARKEAANKKYAYECVIEKIIPPSKDGDRSYKVNVILNPNGFINVWHTTASGKEYDRAAQYKTNQRTGVLRDGEDWNTSPLFWLGTSVKTADLSMEGRIGTNTKTNNMFYTEILFKKVKGKPVAQLLIDSTCHQIAPPAV
jgi:hypothetical protein